MQHGANPDRILGGGNSLILQAINRQMYALAAALVQKGANLRVAGNSPFFLAVRHQVHSFLHFPVHARVWRDLITYERLAMPCGQRAELVMLMMEQDKGDKPFIEDFSDGPFPSGKELAMRDNLIGMLVAISEVRSRASWNKGATGSHADPQSSNRTETGRLEA